MKRRKALGGCASGLGAGNRILLFAEKKRAPYRMIKVIDPSAKPTIHSGAPLVLSITTAPNHSTIRTHFFVVAISQILSYFGNLLEVSRRRFRIVEASASFVRREARRRER